MIQYKVEFLPQNLAIRRDNTGQGFQAAIQTIEGMINHYAAQGWILDHIAQVSIAENPGCLAVLFGAKTVYATYNALIFRLPT
jgi:hypothetical protein